MDQSVLDRAVKIATGAAMNGNPIDRLVWVPPQTGSADPCGNFVVTYCQLLTGSMTPPWLK